MGFQTTPVFLPLSPPSVLNLNPRSFTQAEVMLATRVHSMLDDIERIPLDSDVMSYLYLATAMMARKPDTGPSQTHPGSWYSCIF